MKTEKRPFHCLRWSLVWFMGTAALLATGAGAAQGDQPAGGSGPAIPALEPESGPEGTEVVVRGENFGPSIGAVQGTSGMSFDGVWGAPAYWSEAEIRVAGRAHREKSSCWGAPYLSESGPEQCGISLYPSS